MHKLLFRHRVNIAIRSFWYRFKLVIRQNVMVDKNYFAGDAAVKLITGVLPQGVRITCDGRRDGIGMQALSRISGINFARSFGATYVHTPLSIVGHAPGDMFTWAQAWENLFNFERHGEKYDPDHHIIVDYADYLQGRLSLSSKTVLRFQQCWWFNRRYPDSFTNILAQLQNYFHSVKRQTIPGQISVAVHVRRGDVSTKKNAYRYTPNNRIIRTIDCLCDSAQEAGLDLTFEIHSQGNASDFEVFVERGYRLHLNEDTLVTMQSLASADVLIISKSSFSYVAALLNSGIKVFEPTFNPPMSEWITIKRDGTFDKELMTKRIREISSLSNSA